MPPKTPTGFDPDRLNDLRRPKNLVPRILRREMQPPPDENSGVTDIRVIGVGGAGNNAINRMVKSGLDGVEFIAVNTDAQDLDSSNAHRKILIGEKCAKHLGSGGDPRLGERAATESIDDLARAVEGADMVFVTAGMGGGTGTGATPVIADLALEAGALTVGVATVPFSFEGSRRTEIAKQGLETFEPRVDTLITVHNDKLLKHADARTAFTDAFVIADEMLHRGVQGVADLITTTGLINVDFADVRSVMQNSGTAMMGVGQAHGEERAMRAVGEAMDSPLLNTSIDDASGVLLNITASADVSMAEVNEAAKHVTEVVAPDANIIFGTVVDPEMDQTIRVTLIATGFRAPDPSIRTQRHRRKPREHPSQGFTPESDLDLEVHADSKEINNLEFLQNRQ